MGERTAYGVGWILGQLLRGYRLSWRTSQLGVRPPQPCVLAVWHGRLLGVLLDLRDTGMVSMASLSPDGALAAGAVAALGNEVVRGSSSRGGKEALAALVVRVKGGAPLAGLTVDGPRGPFRKVKPGVVLAAQELGLPIVPASFSARPARVLASWDRMVVPLPFARLTVGYGDPLSPDLLPADTQAACQVVGEALNRLTATLDETLYGESLWPEAL